MYLCLNSVGWRLLASAPLLAACAITADPDGVSLEDRISGAGQTAGRPATGFDCASRTPTRATLVDSDITQDTTWSGTVLLEGNVFVTSGATLTIQPGTQINAAADSQLDVGWNGSGATLLAEGTEAAPIVFCGATATAGFWRGVVVWNSVTSNSKLHNVSITDAGGLDIEQALLIDSELSVQNVQIESSASDGVRARRFAGDSAGLSVRGAAGVAVALADARAVSPFPLGGAFADNGINAVQVEFEDIEVDTAFHDPGVPYVQQSELRVTQGATAHFDAGVEYQFTADTYLEVGWNTNDAVLQIAGTAAAPVVFRGVDETPGSWMGLIVRGNVRTSSTISNLVLRHGGAAGEPALRVDSAIQINDVRLELNETGAYIGAQGLDADSANLSITTTEAVPLTVEPNALISLPQGGVFTGNTTDQIAVEAGDYSLTGTVPNLGIPYLILGAIDTLESSMTIAAGTNFVMSAGADIEFGWNGSSATIIAAGTAAAPIRFTGLDTTAGYWLGLTIGNNVLAPSRLDYVEVSHAGSAGGACLSTHSPIDVTNSTFSTCTGYGILKDSDDVNTYVDTNTFSATSEGDVGTP